MYQLLAYLSCCLLLVAAVTELPELPEDAVAFPSSYDGFKLDELGDPTSQEVDLMDAHKINWLTFAQGQDSNKELVREARDVDQENTEMPITTEAVAIDDLLAGVDIQTEKEENSVPRDGLTACPSTAERGLTRLIRNARALLPAERLVNILTNAREDAEVRELIKLLRSDQFKERVMRLRSTKEEGALRDYLCQGLKLNYAYYIEYVRMFLDLQGSAAPTSPLPNRRKGIRGLLQDLREALPRAQLRDLYRRQLAADKELAAAVRRIRSTEFRRLLSTVRGLPEYQAIRIQLEKAGLPLQQVLNLVANALGWGSLDIGSDTVILSA